MKPPEVLAMIEEAAGTRMFEEKKDKALKTITKKDQKLQEITDVRFLLCGRNVNLIYVADGKGYCA
jgi:chromosome segregation ATPase